MSDFSPQYAGEDGVQAMGDIEKTVILGDYEPVAYVQQN